MDEAEGAPVDAGEFPTNARNLPISPEAQFRNINNRLDELTGQIGKLAKPPTFRTADLLTLAAVTLGLGVAIFTGLGLSDRITDLRANVSDAETKLGALISQSEARLQSRIEKLEGKFQDLDERAAHLEGANTAATPAQKKPNPN